MHRPRLGFVGAGVVGSALAKSLSTAGYPVILISSRSRRRRTDLVRALPGARGAESPQAVADSADLIFLTVPDDAIAPVAAQIAWRAGTSVVHCSGAASHEILDAARACGTQTGVFHPLQTFATAKQAERNLPGSAIGIEASSDELLAVLAGMAEAVGGMPRVVQGDRAIYHVSAVFASNYLVVLLDAASSLWTSLGLSPEEGLRSLLPLVRGTVENLASVGLPDALTGPIARGDVGTIARHLSSLHDVAPDLLPVYKELARRAIPIARAKGRLTEEAARRLRDVLDRPDQGGER